MQMAALPLHLPALAFDYFDVIAAVWLIIGIFRGRKRGMSQEMLPLIQWLAIIVVAGLFYQPFGVLIHQTAQFERLWSNVLAYILIGFGIHLLYLWMKSLVGEKLVGSDLFGRSEYYLGMASGMIRFTCMLVALCALLNARIVSAAERAQTEKMQAQAFSDIRFPTYGSVQQEVLFQSFTGQLIETNLRPLLIVSTAPAKEQKHEIMGQRDLDSILGPAKK